MCKYVRQLKLHVILGFILLEIQYNSEKSDGDNIYTTYTQVHLTGELYLLLKQCTRLIFGCGYFFLIYMKINFTPA
jgi:hypothetical protein